MKKSCAPHLFAAICSSTCKNPVSCSLLLVSFFQIRILVDRAVAADPSLEVSSVNDTSLGELDKPPFSIYNSLNFFNLHEFLIFLISGLNEEFGVAKAYNILCGVRVGNEES